MKYELNQEDVELIAKALEELQHSLFYQSSSAKDLAVCQRVKQIKDKLNVEYDGEQANETE